MVRLPGISSYVDAENLGWRQLSIEEIARDIAGLPQAAALGFLCGLDLRIFQDPQALHAPNIHHELLKYATRSHQDRILTPSQLRATQEPRLEGQFVLHGHALQFLTHLVLMAGRTGGPKQSTRLVDRMSELLIQCSGHTTSTAMHKAESLADRRVFALHFLRLNQCSRVGGGKVSALLTCALQFEIHSHIDQDGRATALFEQSAEGVSLFDWLGAAMWIVLWLGDRTPGHHQFQPSTYCSQMGTRGEIIQSVISDWTGSPHDYRAAIDKHTAEFSVHPYSPYLRVGLLTYPLAAIEEDQGLVLSTGALMAKLVDGPLYLVTERKCPGWQTFASSLGSAYERYAQDVLRAIHELVPDSFELIAPVLDRDGNEIADALAFDSETALWFEFKAGRWPLTFLEGRGARWRLVH